MIADAAINGVHLNNNKRERLNDELWDCLYRARGFSCLIPCLVRLTIIYHNFMCSGSRKDTPAEAALWQSGRATRSPDLSMSELDAACCVRASRVNEKVSPIGKWLYVNGYHT